METSNRLTASGLNSEIKDVRSYSFFQLNSMLKRFSSLHNQLHPNALDIRYRASASLGFPSADIDQYEWKEEGGRTFLELTVSFMGLYGPSSPLPVYYTERIIQSKNQDHPSKDLMDLFNHRLISLFQHCWDKYRYFIKYSNNGQDQYSQWLLSLSGFDKKSLSARTKLQWHKLLPYAGVLSKNICSADLLCKIVKSYFQLTSVEIESWIKRCVAIPNDQTNRIGINNYALGGDLVLGDEVEDCSGKFNLHIYDLSQPVYNHLLPDQNGFDELVQLIRFLQKDALEFNICLHLSQNAESEREGDHLSDRDEPPDCGRLGWNKILGDALPSETYEAEICVHDYISF